MSKNKIIITIVISIFIIIVILVTIGNAKKIMVIGYHRFVPDEIKNNYYKDDIWIDSLDNLKFQLRFFKIFGYKTLSLEEYKCWHNKTCKQPKRSVLLTFDDGDKSIYYEVLPLLKKYDMNGTVFIIGEKVYNDDKYNSKEKQFLSKKEIQLIKEEYPKLEIQNHSYGMHKNNSKGKKIIYSMSKNDIENDFKEMEKYKMKYFCYPGGAYNKDLLDVLEEKKYEMSFCYDKSKLSSKDDEDFLIPRVSINGGTSKIGFLKWIIKTIINNI